ncbi:ATP-dependent helicase [Mesoplasma tabanidae]|uniref:DNA 3'-5' helicase n=1 Tax=Mesoplasma tabanidae TaxID=219745 RepID=A0A2K8P6R1_9MOLU|nr:UvrD-helicase domain-containing protein [Mesoplasma tabanidae]ATZ21810.1 ATP-dependent DNA helicase [Mesoplasma tabanidae]
MNNLLLQLNEQQLAAVTITDKPLRIVAGAGSGKTKVITTKIAYLIGELKMAPYKILAVTFTNKAAREMRDRVNKIIPDLTSNPHISTFHAWCSRVLREDFELIGLNKNFLIIDQGDQVAIIRNLINEHFSHLTELKKYTEKKIIYRIGNWKNDLISPLEAMEDCYSGIERAIATLYQKYEDYLKTINSIDFNDLQVLVFKLFNEHSDALEKWRNRYDYVMVDEFQDTNDLQFDLIKFLTRDKNNLTVVGDPDQTIYSWRGAKVDIILNFTKAFLNGVSITLNQNYRSTQKILDLANDFINNNKNREAKDIFTNNVSGDLPIVKECESRNDEARYVTLKIKELIQNGYEYKDIFILYRLNAWSQEFEKEFQNNKIPFQLIGGIRFKDRKVIKEANAFLRTLAAKDEQAVERVLKSIPKVGDVTIKKLKEKAQDMKVSLYDLIVNEDELHINQISKHLTTIRNVLAKSVDVYNENKNIRVTLQYMLVESGYMQKLKDTEKKEDISYIESLYDQLENFDKSYQVENSEEEATEKIVSYLQEEALLNSDADDIEAQKVTLLTVHAAKGLENKIVFVVGLNQDVFPGRLSANSAKEIEEERRALYVAITRAEEKVFITYIKGEFSFISQSELAPSKFIKEFDQDLYHFEGKYQKSSNPFANISHLGSPNLNTQNKVSVGYEKNDIIEHMIFGDGVVIEINGQTMKVAFSSSYGIMPISVSDATISKKN